MNIKQFQELSKRTAPFNANPQNVIEYQNILGNYSMGLVGEWFELQQELAKVDINGDIPMEAVNAIDKEVGDVMHYAVNLLTVVNRELDETKINSEISIAEVEGSLCNVLEMPKKHIYHGHDLDVDKYADSIHKVISHLNHNFNRSIPSILKKNIEKLKLRYPDKFNTADSIKRVDTK